jgi:hypothetical protein
MMQGFTDASLDDAPAWGTKAEVDVSAVRVGEYLRSLGFCDRHETDLLKKMVDHMTRSLPS